MLPFDLPPVAPALALLDASLLDLGERAARAAARGLSSVLGGEASLHGRILPGLPEPAGAALVPIELTALAGVASLAVDRGFAARLAGRVAGGTGRAGPPGSLGAAERAVVELAVLGALDALAAETEIEGPLAPRLALRAGSPLRPVCIELTVSAAGAKGRAFLFLPEAALRALPRDGGVPLPLRDVLVRGSVRGGRTELDPGEVEALREGDVLLLEGPPGGVRRDPRSRAAWPRAGGWPGIHWRSMKWTCRVPAAPAARRCCSRWSWPRWRCRSGTWPGSLPGRSCPSGSTGAAR